MHLKKKRWGKYLAIALVFTFLFQCLGMVMPESASAAISITITGEGVNNPITFSQSELEALPQVQARYSVINTWPTKKWYVAEGVRLGDLLAAAEIKDEATLINMKSTDGYNLTFTLKELLEDTRYYYPGLKENAEYDGSIPGSPDGAVPVDTILALKSAESDNFSYMSSTNAPHLVMGQRWVTEQTNNAFVKYVGTITVTTGTPAKWENPIADPDQGTVAAGTGVIFDPVNITDMDGANFHYTTDGSDPTFESPMYNWIKYRWWSSRSDDLATINHPIIVNQNMTIKAKAIGFGRDDSDIVTFSYQVPVGINTGNPANATRNQAYAGHTFTATSGVEPYSFAVTTGALPAGMVLNGVVLEGTPTESGTFVFTVTVTDSADPVGTNSHEYTLVVDEAGPAAPPALTSDNTDNQVGQAIDITFIDDAAWRAAISGIKADDTALSTQEYFVTEGKITIIADVFSAAGDYLITVQAAGYSDAVVTQTVEPVQEFVVVDGVLTAYQGAGGDVIIPGDLGITAIGNKVFEKLSSLTSVVIPEGVTSIGNYAFRDAANLSSVSIPQGVISIGNYAFSGCSSLGSIVIPGSVTSMGTNVFSGCTSLTSITVPGSVTSIASRMFNGCSNLSSVTISEGVTGIGTYAFSGCSKLSSISIPNTVTSIESSAFSGCSSLTSVTIPDSVESLGTGIFNNCSGLTTITIPNHLTSLPDSIFKNCSSLQSFTIPGSVTQIGGSVFYGCSSLTSIDIPDSVTSMGGNAFWNCSSLTSITIPDGITRLSDYIFYNCSSLSSITIPDSVNDFGFYAFANCTSLSSLIIPDDFTAIRDGVFSGCTSLSSITIPAGVTSIGNDAFLNCSNLTIYGYAGSYAESYAASNSIPFVAIDGASAPLLIADNSDNTVGQAIDITFTDDADWRAAITGISVGGSALSESQYTVTEGNINIVADVFTAAGDYTVVVTATGYSDATVTQTIVEIVGPTTWYVDDSGGADFTSIQAAVTAASDGDTIMVKDGTYTENVVVDKSLVIQSENGADLTIVQAAVTTSDVFEAKAGNVTIDGFTVSGASSTDKSGIAISGTSSGHCTIINNQCTGNSLGIAIKGLSSNNQNVNNTVTGNSCSASGQYGIYLSNTSSNSVTGNTFSNNPGSGYTGYGICLFDNADNNTFNNNIADSNNMGLRVKNADNNTIINNTFSNNNIGIELATKPIGNVFYQNNLKKNTTQLSEGYNGNTENSWNSPSEITYTYQGSQYSSQLGNYWSDYSGADSDGDGIGDSPYATISTYSDNYPLMGQWQDGVITIQAASPPHLTADNSDNTAGQAIDITFTDDADWRAAITGITVGGSAMSESQYAVTEGNINIVADVFTAAGDYAVVVTATGYSEATVTQTINAPSPIAITIDGNVVGTPITYTLAELRAMPVTNVENAGKTYTGVAVDYLLSTLGTVADDWEVSIKIKDAANPLNLANYSDPILAYERDGEAFADSYGSETTYLRIANESSNIKYVYGMTVDKPVLLTPPVLTADSSDNTVGQAIDISFTDDTDWRAAITGITVGGSALSDTQYTVTAGNINIAADVFTAAGDYAIAVQATGYSDATVTQTVLAIEEPSAVYSLSPAADDNYTPGTTVDGINTMTVKAGVSGFKYFTVEITPVTPHAGNETVVFTHLRNGIPQGINATRADFDQVSTAHAGFNVQAGDVIKVYIVDELTNDEEVNPIILQ